MSTKIVLKNIQLEFNNDNINLKDYIIRNRVKIAKPKDGLRDISLEIFQGEKVGIIGSNGAGKSTLLRIIAGIYFPDSGSIEVYGKVAPLIELGVGFNGEMSGEENVILIGRSVAGIRPETGRSIHDQAEGEVILTGGPNPRMLKNPGMSCGSE